MHIIILFNDSNERPKYLIFSNTHLHALRQAPLQNVQQSFLSDVMIEM